jgi:4-diphosphocytidyl-2-C-methyl-D-erythritol kinase
MLKLLSEATPAKINLWLRITGRRLDGYHELDSVFIPIPLWDRVGLGMRLGHAPAVWLRCDHLGLGPESANLAVRAAHAFMDEFGTNAEVMVDLHKKIPAGAGLGGGSSDAAAVLRMMARLCGISDQARLGRTALKLGADVPFFLDPAPARVQGIGEQIEKIEFRLPLNLVVAVPPINVSTAQIFGRLPREGWSGAASDGDLYELAAGRVNQAMLVNDLAPVAIELYPAIGSLITAIRQVGATDASMSGSGGAAFGIFASESAVREAGCKVKERHPSARVFAVFPGSAVEVG